MAAFLLIHGAWHDERCWDSLVPELAARGHAVHTLTLPGHWDRVIPSYKISLKRYGQAICEAARQIGEPVILVGHSMGGMAISRAAEMQPNLFSQLVYLAAYLPKLNKWTRMQSLVLSDPQTHIWSTMRLNLLRLRAHLRPELVADVFYHDCSPDLAKRAVERLCSQSGLPLIEFARITEEGAASLPMTYIECLQDRVVSLELQRRMQTHASFEQVLSIDSSHSPFLSKPIELSETLHGVAGGQKSTRDVGKNQTSHRTSRGIVRPPSLDEAKSG